MVKFGTSTILLGVHDPYPLQCPHCKKLGSLDFMITGNYFYIYYIPIWPTGKEGYGKCSNCGFKIDTLKYNKLTRDSFKDFSKNYRYPAYAYVGIILISFFVLMIILTITGAFSD